jgi:muramoyltetrapeptide carboxypeptidase
MFVRDDIRAIVCARGGYGSNYLPPASSISRQNRGASQDLWSATAIITTLLTCIADSRQLSSPFTVRWSPQRILPFGRRRRFDPRGRTRLERSLCRGVGASPKASGAKPLVAGERPKGILYGGCLSILVAALGTPYDIQTAGTILFLEDIAAKPFQIDRMLMQLKLAGRLDGVRGIVFGEMLDCRQGPDSGLHFGRSCSASGR